MKKTTAAWQPIFVFSLFLILLSLFFYLKKPSNKTTANNILQAIPQKDKKILNRFFNQLMFQDSFVFILFGTKPMGTATTSLDHRSKSSSLMTSKITFQHLLAHTSLF